MQACPRVGGCPVPPRHTPGLRSVAAARAALYCNLAGAGAHPPFLSGSFPTVGRLLAAAQPQPPARAHWRVFCHTCLDSSLVPLCAALSMRHSLRGREAPTAPAGDRFFFARCPSVVQPSNKTGPSPHGAHHASRRGVSPSAHGRCRARAAPRHPPGAAPRPAPKAQRPHLHCSPGFAPAVTRGESPVSVPPSAGPLLPSLLARPGSCNATRALPPIERLYR